MQVGTGMVIWIVLLARAQQALGAAWEEKAMYRERADLRSWHRHRPVVYGA